MAICKHGIENSGETRPCGTCSAEKMPHIGIPKDVLMNEYEGVLKRLTDVMERSTSIMEERSVNDADISERSLAEAIYIEFVTSSMPSAKEAEAFADAAIDLAKRFSLAWENGKGDH